MADTTIVIYSGAFTKDFKQIKLLFLKIRKIIFLFIFLSKHNPLELCDLNLVCSIHASQVKWSVNLRPEPTSEPFVKVLISFSSWIADGKKALLLRQNSDWCSNWCGAAVEEPQ